MRLFDPKIARNVPRYLLQCLLATLVVFLIMGILNAQENAAVVGSLGASSFIAFAMPHKKASGARYLVGGYAIGILFGVLCGQLCGLEVWTRVAVISQQPTAFFGGMAVGLAILAMVLTDLEHPPAAGVALGLVLNNCDWHTVGIVFAGIVLLATAKELLKRYMIDLL